MTEVLIILLGNYHKFAEGIHVWMETGKQGDNSFRYIDINEIAKEIGDILCRSLPGFHSFTGCDYTAAFFKKEKKRPFKILEKKTAYQEAFASLGESEEISEGTYQEMEKFTCKMYGLSKRCLINEARLCNFISAYQPKTTMRHPLKNIRVMNVSAMPPCQDSLKQKIRRSN